MRSSQAQENSNSLTPFHLISFYNIPLINDDITITTQTTSKPDTIQCELFKVVQNATKFILIRYSKLFPT